MRRAGPSETAAPTVPLEPMVRMTASRGWRAGAVYAAAAFLAAIILALLSAVVRRDPGADGPIYALMVREPGAAVGLAHRFRVLGPAIVRALPMATDEGFLWFTYGSCFVAALLHVTVARALGHRARQALLAVPLFLFSWGSVASLRYFRQVDCLAWVCMAAGFLALVRGRPLWALLVASVGALARETVLSIVPAVLMHEWLKARRRPSWSLWGLAAVSVIPYLLVQATISRQGVPGPSAFLQSHWSVQLQELGLLKIIAFWGATHSFLWVLAAVGFPDAAPGVRRLSLVWMLWTIPTGLLSSPERMLNHAAPALIALAVAATAGRYRRAAVTLLVANSVLLTRFAGKAPMPLALWVGAAFLGLAVSGGLLWKTRPWPVRASAA